MLWIQGKGVAIHSLVDGQGLPLAMCVTAANESEREQVIPLLQSIKIQTGHAGRPKSNPSNLAADKGYDAQSLRHQLRQKGIRPEIPKRQWSSKKKRGRKMMSKVNRFVVERTFAWFQKKFRRIVVR